MPHLPPGSIDGGSVTIWLPCTQQGGNGSELSLFNAKPSGHRGETVQNGSGETINVVSNSYRLNGYHVYLVEVLDEDGTVHHRFVPTNRCRVNFYFATDEDMDKAGIPRKGPAREKAILALNKEKWALSPQKH